MKKRLKCIDISKWQSGRPMSLTVGKYYTVVKDLSASMLGSLIVRNDLGVQENYYKWRFDPTAVEEGLACECEQCK